ncbi:MAG TPA: sulfite exporter TauE/SafE family protein [Edaphocola sp.]|nr:sulfite exporter TauE/SafE family protein [Edaphocola sp.]
MQIILILTISFLASLFRSTLGFGESLIAVPLFLLFLPLKVAVPLSVLLSIIIALIIVIQDHKNIHFQSAKWLVIYAITGIPLGLLILIYGNETLVKITLGFLIIIYSLYTLLNTKIKIHKPENNKLWLFICGFLSGVFGGAYGLNGPPLVIYGKLQNWTAKHFRATLQAYFLPASLIGAIGYYTKGLITAEVNQYFLYSLTTTVPAIFLGRYLNSKLNGKSFYKYINWFLIIIGLVLILSSLK